MPPTLDEEIGAPGARTVNAIASGPPTATRTWPFAEGGTYGMGAAPLVGNACVTSASDPSSSVADAGPAKRGVEPLGAPLDEPSRADGGSTHVLHDVRR